MGLFLDGKCSSALKFFNELQAAGLKPHFYTYCNLLNGLCENEHAEQACRKGLLLLNALQEKGEHVHIA